MMPMMQNKMPMMPEDDMMPEAQPVGAFESMLSGNMPGPAELNDLLGLDGPSFHDSLAGENPPLGPLGSSTGGAIAEGGEADYTGQASYDPAQVKQDVRALLTQKAQERSAATEEFQARANNMMGGAKQSSGY